MKKIVVFFALVFLLSGCTQKPPQDGILACKSDSDCNDTTINGPNCEGSFKCLNGQCTFKCIESEDDNQTQAPIELKEKEGTVYIAFRILTKEQLDHVIQKVGGTGNPNGKHRLAVSAHLNPIGGLYNSGPPNNEIDEEKLNQKLATLKDFNLPVTMGLFAGKFFESPTTRYLEQTNYNLMWNEDNQPIILDRVGGTYFSLSPTAPSIARNEFLEVYEKNVRTVSRIVAQWAKENPSLAVSVSFAGETKYPPAKERIGNRNVLRWADYNPLTIKRFQDYEEQKFAGDFKVFLEKMLIPEGTFNGFEDIDPPRAKDRGKWDTLEDESNPYFLEWFEFRVEEVKNHIKQNVQWGKEEGIEEKNILRIYSHQAVWDKVKDPKNYYWRGSPIETLNIPGINPAISMYDETTAEEEFIQRVGEIGRRYHGRWSTLQYNPDGPCDENGNCDPNGWPVGEYLRRLKLLEENGIRVIAVEGSEIGEESGSEDGKKHFIRENFYTAVKLFLAEE